jgi:hypothetical protein
VLWRCSAEMLSMTGQNDALSIQSFLTERQMTAILYGTELAYLAAIAALSAYTLISNGFIVQFAPVRRPPSLRSVRRAFPQQWCNGNRKPR